MCLSDPTTPRGYCEGGIDLKQMRRRLTRLSVTSKMGESGRETVVSSPKGGAPAKGFLPGNNGLIEAAKLN